MKIFLNLRKVPELKGLNRKDALEVHKMSCDELFTNHIILYHALPAGILTALGAWAGQYANHFIQSDFSAWYPIIGAVLAGGIGGFISVQLNVNYLRKYYPENRKIYENYQQTLNSSLTEPRKSGPVV